ncbi:MAG: glycosyltransferase family 4 protein [Methylobacter sp.]
MKLLFLIENNEPHSTGGGYYAIFKFAEFLAKRGHDILIYAVHDYQWIIEKPNLRIYYRPSVYHKNRVMRKFDKLLDYGCDRILLTKLIDEFSPDWIFGVLKESAIKAVQLGKQFNIRVANFIYECPNWLRTIYGQELYDQQNKGYTRKLWEMTRVAYLESDILFPNSTLSKIFNQDWLGIETINAPIYPGIDPLQMAFEQPDYSDKNKSVLYVGRLAKEKNVHHLIEAWKLMPKDISLHIVGDGPEKRRLQEQSIHLPHVTFHGFVSDEQLWTLFKSSKMLVCPSNFEGFGMPPMQSLYFGKPCLVSDIPIFHSIYGNYVDYYEVGNIDQLVSGVQKILNNEAYMEEKGQAGRLYILENFTWELAAENIETSLLKFNSLIK